MAPQQWIHLRREAENDRKENMKKIKKGTKENIKKYLKKIKFPKEKLIDTYIEFGCEPEFDPWNFEKGYNCALAECRRAIEALLKNYMVKGRKCDYCSLKTNLKQMLRTYPKRVK